MNQTGRQLLGRWSQPQDQTSSSADVRTYSPTCSFTLGSVVGASTACVWLRLRNVSSLLLSSLLKNVFELNKEGSLREQKTLLFDLCFEKSAPKLLLLYLLLLFQLLCEGGAAAAAGFYATEPVEPLSIYEFTPTLDTP